MVTSPGVDGNDGAAGGHNGKTLAPVTPSYFDAAVGAAVAGGNATTIAPESFCVSAGRTR